MAEATLANWRQSPQNQWAFRNVDKLINTHTIKAPSNASTLESSPEDLSAFRVKDFDLQTYLNWSNTDEFVVLHKGKVVHEFYDHGNDASSKHIMMSMTKSVSGLVTGSLVRDGKLDVTKPIKDYVPEAASVYDGVTIQQCLDMETGIKYDDNSHDYRGSAGWNPMTGEEKYKTLSHFLSSVEVAEKGPTGAFNYCSVNTDLLGWALERASGKKLAELIQQYVWKPIGAESDANITVDSEGLGRAAGGMSATIRDIARIGQGIIDGKLSSEWIDDMLQNGNREGFSGSAWAPMTKGLLDEAAYRDCWIGDKESRTLCAMGIFGQQLMVDLKHGIVMAKTASQPDPLAYDKILANMAAFRELTRVLN